MFSRPAKADASRISVDLCKWKLVINESVSLNLYGGYINKLVHPELFPVVLFFAIVSRTLHVDVPVAKIFFPSDFALFIVSTASSGIL